MPAAKLTPTQKILVQSLRSAGKSMREIAGDFGVSIGTINRAVNPDPSPSKFAMRTDAPPSSDVDARRSEIPRDTRSLTARVLGDPLPGRSAFDRSQGA